MATARIYQQLRLINSHYHIILLVLSISRIVSMVGWCSQATSSLNFGFTHLPSCNQAFTSLKPLFSDHVTERTPLNARNRHCIYLKIRIEHAICILLILISFVLNMGIGQFMNLNCHHRNISIIRCPAAKHKRISGIWSWETNCCKEMILQDRFSEFQQAVMRLTKLFRVAS